MKLQFLRKVLYYLGFHTISFFFYYVSDSTDIAKHQPLSFQQQGRWEFWSCVAFLVVNLRDITGHHQSIEKTGKPQEKTQIHVNDLVNCYRRVRDNNYI